MEIILSHLGFSYGGRPVIEDMSYTFATGIRYGISGASGSGKTTLLRLIAGLEVPARGSIRAGGKIMSEAGRILVPPHLRRTGFVFQDLALFPHMTVYQNIAFGLQEQKHADVPQRVSGILKDTGLESLADKYPHQLSGGQQQLVAIARSLVLEPGVLLMDEPMANLDRENRERIFGILFELHRRTGFTLLYVSHDGSDLNRMEQVLEWERMTKG